MTETIDDRGRKFSPDGANAAAIGGEASEAAPDSTFSGTGTAFDTRLLRQIAAIGREEDYWDTAEASAAALMAMGPRTPGETMLAALAIAVSDTTMDCLQRAAVPTQPADVRAANLKFGFQGATLVPQLLDAFEKQRGGGQRNVTVERVTVEAGGQAIVGDVHVDKKAVAPVSLGVEVRAVAPLDPAALKPARRTARPRVKSSASVDAASGIKTQRTQPTE